MKKEKERTHENEKHKGRNTKSVEGLERQAKQFSQRPESIQLLVRQHRTTPGGPLSNKHEFQGKRVGKHQGKITR